MKDDENNQDDEIPKRQRRSSEDIAKKKAESIDQKNEEEIKTNKRVTFEYDDTINPEDLKPHPVNVALYGKEEVDESLETLIESIQKHGQLEPIIITPDKIIISGHRRWRALMEINTRKKRRKEIRGLEDFKNNYIPAAGRFTKVKAKCQIANFANEWEEQLAIIEYNKRRDKRISQTYNEIELLHDILDPDALRRRNANLRNVIVTPDSAYRDLPGFSAEEQMEETRLIRKQLREEEEEYETEADKAGYDIEIREVRCRIAKILGMGKDKVRKIEQIGRLAKIGDEVAIKIMKHLDVGKTSVHTADYVRRLEEVFREGRPGAIFAHELIEQVLQGIEASNKKNAKTGAKAFAEFEEQFPPEKEKQIIELDKSRKTYSIILINYNVPKSAEDPYANFQHMRDANMPAAKDAALFITMNKETVKYCFKLFNKWEFDIQSFAVISDDPTGYNMLLHGTRGKKWVLPEDENQFSCSLIQDKEGIYTAINQLYPNIESLYEMGVDPQHDGWGKSIESLQPKEEEPQPPTEEDEDDDGEPFESPFKNFKGRF